MSTRYLKDTDTAWVDLASTFVAKTPEGSENVPIDLDRDSGVAGIRIEPASVRGDMSEISFKPLPTKAHA